MKKHFKLALVSCFGLVSAISLAADGVKMNGNVEGGYAYSWQSTPSVKDAQWLVDNLSLGLTAQVSDKVKIVVNNAMSVTPGTASALGAGWNSVAYYSRATLVGSNTRPGYTLANNAAYLEHKCTDNLTWSFGHISVPFGNEMGGDRYDKHGYYYSYGNRLARAYGWDYDLGLKLHIHDLLPGNWQLAVFDGRAIDAKYSPGVAFRWDMEAKSGDMTFTPSAGVLASRWRGSPGDLGFTAGLGWQMGMVSTDAEFVYTSNDIGFGTDTKLKGWSVAVEPGFDFAFAKVSIPWEYFSYKALTAAAVNDMNLGVAITHEYADKFRIRVSYQHANLGGKGVASNYAGTAGLHGNDFRVLFGTKW